MTPPVKTLCFNSPLNSVHDGGSSESTEFSIVTDALLMMVYVWVGEREAGCNDWLMIRVKLISWLLCMVVARQQYTVQLSSSEMFSISSVHVGALKLITWLYNTTATMSCDFIPIELLIAMLLPFLNHWMLTKSRSVLQTVVEDWPTKYPRVSLTMLISDKYCAPLRCNHCYASITQHHMMHKQGWPRGKCYQIVFPRN